MTGSWLDELVDGDNDLEVQDDLEEFYILVALELGDPDSDRWLERNATALYKLWDKFRAETKKYLFSGPAVALQYMQWYERNRPTVDTHHKKTHTRHINESEATQEAPAYSQVDVRNEGRLCEDDEGSADSD